MKKRRIRYGVEEYLADKQAAATQTEKNTAPMAKAVTTSAPKNYTTENDAALKTTPTTSSTAASVAPKILPTLQSGGQQVSGATQPLTMSDRWNMEMTNARNKVYEVLNRKFSYNERSSPLYSILQKQYEREAERAEGRAYAQSVANTGGFGSSYATLASAEARRQTMEGFAGQQASLYDAAREEFLAERQSAVDWYNQAKTMYGDALNQEITDAYDKGIGSWLQNRDENEVREALKKEGYSETVISNAILMMREYSAATDQYSELISSDSEVKEKIASGVSYLLSSFDTYAEDTMRSLLVSSGQYSEEEIKQIMSQVKNTFQSTITDEGKTVSGITDAITYKASLDAALKNGTMTVEEYDAEWEANSQKIMSEITRNIDDLGSFDYASIGISQEEWDGMEDADKKLAVFDAVGQLVKSGAVAPWQYRQFLYDDTKEMLNSKDFKESQKQILDILDRGVILKDLYESGYMRDDDYTILMTELLVPYIENSPAIKRSGDKLVVDLTAGILPLGTRDISEEQAKALGDMVSFLPVENYEEIGKNVMGHHKRRDWWK